MGRRAPSGTRGLATHPPHFAGFPAILVRLDEISVEDLDEVVTEAWLVQAPKRVARAYLESR